jgi:hypothetical protein
MTSTREQQPAHHTPVMVSLGLLVRTLGGSDLLIDVPRSQDNTRWETEWRAMSVCVKVDEARLFLLGSQTNKERGTMGITMPHHEG